jgi:hypothetical protein
MVSDTLQVKALQVFHTAGDNLQRRNLQRV